LLDEVVGSIDDKRKRKGTIDVLEKSRFFHLAIAGYSAEIIPETDGYAARIIMKFLPSLRYLAYYY